MKKFFFYLIAAVAVCCMTACGSDDDPDPGKIELANGQSNKVSCWSNTSSGAITFKASGAWIATVEAVSRAGADWLHLDRTSGTAGDVTLNFTLDPNDTGASRSANIIIVCGDTRVIITITQSPEDDPDGGDEPIALNRLAKVFPSGYVLSKYGDETLFEYDDYNLELIRVRRGEFYYTLNYNGNRVNLNFYQDPDNSLVRSYIITLDDAGMFAKHIEAFVNYKKYTFDLDYTDGYLTKVVSKGSPEDDTTVLTWENGNIVKNVTTLYNGDKLVYDFKYTNIENKSSLMLYANQFCAGPEEEVILYFAGLLGMPTRHLLASTAATETTSSGTSVYGLSYSYTFNDLGFPVKMIEHEFGDDDGPYDLTYEYTFSWMKLFGK